MCFPIFYPFPQEHPLVKLLPVLVFGGDDDPRADLETSATFSDPCTLRCVCRQQFLEGQSRFASKGHQVTRVANGCVQYPVE